MIQSSPLQKSRIGYIDALRGFTMILVVCVHVATFSRVKVFPYSNFFELFRMPLFFFISGFILYKREFVWNLTNSAKFLSKKFLVQIIPTAIFLSIFLFTFDYSLVQRGLNGYWFTVALFEFFIVYTLCNFIFRKQFIVNILLIGGAIYVNSLAFDPMHYSYIPVTNDFIIYPFSFFIFFLMGTLVKKYFDKVCKYIFDNNIIMLISTIIMIVGAIAYINNYYVQFETKLILSIVGILSIFYFFMRNGDYMDNSRVGKGLQYIGRRTLDVYLLHYFFVTNSLTWINKWGVTSPTMKFVLSILTALVIIGICLLISKFLRTNPLLGKILFGAKMPQKTKN